jgi:hypothetical protein
MSDASLRPTDDCINQSRSNSCYFFVRNQSIQTIVSQIWDKIKHHSFVNAPTVFVLSQLFLSLHFYTIYLYVKLLIGALIDLFYD